MFWGVTVYSFVKHAVSVTTKNFTCIVKYLVEQLIFSYLVLANRYFQQNQTEFIKTVTP